MSATSHSPDSLPTLASGTVILGKLRIARIIGSGGMGVVYEVEHELTKHRRALKVLHTRAAKQPVVVERFLREASAAGRIDNGHIAETFDAGRLESGEPYLLMELVDGETLDQRVERLGPLPPGELADLVHQACEGVQAAHDAGIVHRDLKPENLIVTAREGALYVKILDFGISKFDTDRTGTLGITTEGSLMGTPYYMSPEQVRGTMAIDARTDVYSLGVILYQCASGVRPYDARSIEALAVMIHEGKATPLHERRPSLPQAFCAIVEKAMATDRERRFDSARALGEALLPMRTRVVLATSSPSGPPPRAIVRPTPSLRPDGDAPMSAVPSSTEAALAATMGSLPGAPPARGIRTAVSVAAAIGVLALGGTATLVARSLHASRVAASAPVLSSASLPLPPESSAPPATVLAPLPPLVPVVSPPPPAPRPSGEALRANAPEEPATSASTRRATPSAPPEATPSSKSRVDQKGLAGENPFR